MNLLIYPPFVDPTQPYLALPMLKGYLKTRQLDAHILDLNVEAAHYILDRSYILSLVEQLGQRFATLNQQKSLTFMEQWEYLTLLHARDLIPSVLACDIPLVQFFQDPERFYHAGQYFWARDRVNELWEIISAVYFPYQYNFNSAGHLVAPWDWHSLENYWQQKHSPIHALYEKTLSPFLPNLDFVGISLSFVSQISEAFYLCHLIRSLVPHCFIILGGACIHQILMHSQSDVANKILQLVNGVGLFEGEELLAQLLANLPAWQAAPTSTAKQELLRNIPNLASWNQETQTIQRGPLHVQDLQNPTLPDYSDLDLDRYLAPSRTLLYAPTRGCYWNKCSFCEYGFSQSGSHRYREVPASVAVDQMSKLSRKYGVKNFYLSCDVMAPKYAVDLSTHIAEKKLPLRWNSDLRIEKFYTKEQCAILYQGGCRAVAFGIESGSDRVLQLMHKGTTRQQIVEVNRNFHDSGIATAWMMFHYHPGETGAEAMQTISLIKEQFAWVDLFIVGEFELTPGSRIACHPEEYGISQIYHAIGDEFQIYPMFREQEKNDARRHQQELDGHLAALAENFLFSKYPWAGAISTHHTFLYFLRYGQRAFAGSARLKAPQLNLSKVDLKIPGLRAKPRFSVREMESAQQKFLARYSKLVLQPDETKIHTPLCVQHFEQEASKMPVIHSK